MANIEREPAGVGATTSESPNRPRVICHMLASIDGRIVTDQWPLSESERKEYEQVHKAYNADGWLCGRVTMEQHPAARTRSGAEVDQEHDGPAREDFVAPGEHASFAFAIDSRGRLLWQSSDVDGDHVVAILSECVADDYLKSLRDRGVSYVLAGKREVDLMTALDKIGRLFGVKTLMLEGGGRINGSMLRAGLIDEVSLLVAPVADTRMHVATLFDTDVRGGSEPAFRLALIAIERRGGDVVWLRYSVTSAP